MAQRKNDAATYGLESSRRLRQRKKCSCLLFRSALFRQAVAERRFLGDRSSAYTDSDGSTIALLIAAVMSAAMTYYAPIISIGFGALACGLIIWINWLRPWRYKRRMRRPFDAYFGGGTRAEWTHELHVQPYTEIDLQIRIEPALNYTQHEIAFGFEGEEGNRPEPIKTKNTFVKVGIRKEVDPTREPTHYIDVKDAYHIQDTKERTKGNTYTLGFVVRTHGPGKFPVRLFVISDTGESLPRKPLTVIVDASLGQ